MSAAAGIGGRIAPVRFLAFLFLLVAGCAGGVALMGRTRGLMAGFDLAAVVFLLTCLPLLDDPPGRMRDTAARNDANRAVLLAITGAVMLAILAAIGSELGGSAKVSAAGAALVVATLALAWLFGNTVYALHYAHLFYLAGDAGKDAGGLDVPGTDEPNYWDFVYFAFTLGMTFQTSDVSICSTPIRRVVVAHCLAAFVFNLGVIAFTINVLGGS